MKRPSTSHQLVSSPAQSHRVLGRDAVRQGVALCLLLAMMAWAVMGPSGLVAWGENYQRLAQRRTQLAQLTAERDELKNRVNLLDPARADPDLTGELLRSNLNVIHPDEMVLQIKH